MSRLTRKTNGKDYYSYCIYIEKTNELFGHNEELLSPEEYYKEEPYQMEDSYYLEDAMNRLGEIEDLMEEYELDSVEKLENALAVKVVAGGMRISGKRIVTKGILYNILREEISCPLDVAIKAMKEGITIVTFEPDRFETGTDTFERPRLYYSDDYKCYCFELAYGSHYVKLQDYNKTWWLKGEKNAD